MKEYVMYLTQEELDVLARFIGTCSSYMPHELLYYNMYISLSEFKSHIRNSVYDIVDGRVYTSINSNWCEKKIVETGDA